MWGVYWTDLGVEWGYENKGNTAQLKLRRFAEILRPDFVAISR